jgi:hypothetical protein
MFATVICKILVVRVVTQSRHLRRYRHVEEHAASISMNEVYTCLVIWRQETQGE